MSDEHGDYLYNQWMARKASAMRRPVLSCGCRNDGRSTYVRGTCDCLVCSEHRDDGHEHAEEPERVEALRPVDLSLGARHHLTGGVYEVTETDGRNATLTPVRSPWWKPNTWRRT